MNCVMLICLYYDLNNILYVCIPLHMHVYTKVCICNGDYIEVYWALKLVMLKQLMQYKMQRIELGTDLWLE